MKSFILLRFLHFSLLSCWRSHQHCSVFGHWVSQGSVPLTSIQMISVPAVLTVRSVEQHLSFIAEECFQDKYVTLKNLWHRKHRNTLKLMDSGTVCQHHTYSLLTVCHQCFCACFILTALSLWDIMSCRTLPAVFSPFAYTSHRDKLQPDFAVWFKKKKK